jgi:hypothetical protein
MRYVPRLPVGFTDLKLIRLFNELIRALSNVLDCNTYKITRVWSVPFSLSVPVAGDMPRNTPPDIVRVARAFPTDDPLTVVHFGATAWTWQGANQVQITDVDGLVEGVKYTLVFEVVG